jgi:CelD/BcsL family acetyltransferase involved in cellulose biosynthesis
MPLHARLTPIAEIELGTERAWGDLALHGLEPNPFFEPTVARAAARHLGFDVWVLTVERGGDLVLCLPLQRRTLRWRRLPVRAWSTWDPIGVPLVDGRDPEAALGAAVAHLAEVGGPRFLVLDWMAGDGPVAAALAAATAARRPAWLLADPRRARPVLRRREDADYLATTLHGKHKRRQRNKRRNLERQLGAPLELVDEGARIEAVDRLLSIEFGGWKGGVGTAVLCRPDRASYFRAICAAFAEQGRLQIVSLQAAGTTVAMKCDIRAGDATFGLRTAYEDRFAKASPGVELEIEAVGAFHASGARIWDSATNHPENPQQWLWPDKRPVARAVVSLGGALGRIATSRAARAAERRFATAEAAKI